jgi:hypothetical protein
MHEWIGRKGIGICIQKWKMGEASFGIHLCVVFAAEALGFLDSWSELYMVGVRIAPSLWSIACRWVDGLTMLMMVEWHMRI